MLHRFQAGLSLAGFMFVIVIIGLVAVLAMKVVPTIVEYHAVKNAVATASRAESPAAIKESFEKQRSTAYIDSVNASDLEIVKTANGFEVSVAYERRIPLVGPASLVLDYQASSSDR